MRLIAFLFAAVALVGCDAPGIFQGPDTTPRWSTAQSAPVLQETWLDGFVHPDDWNADTLEIYGSGRWQATRAFAPSTGSPSIVVASGSISQEELGAMLTRAFERPLGGQRFLDLPARLDPGIADGPVVTLAVSLDNASHSVTVTGPKPEPFTRFEAAIATRTIVVPFPD